MKNNYAGQLILFLIILTLNFCHSGKDIPELNERLNEDSLQVVSLYNSYQRTHNSDFDSSQVYLEHLLQEISRLPDEELETRILYLSRLSDPVASSGNIKLSDSVSAISLNLAYENKLKKLYPDVHENRGLYFWFENDIDSAAKHLRLAIHYAEENHDIRSQIVSRLNLVSLLMEVENTDTTIHRFKEIIELCEKHNFNEYLYAAYANLGSLYTYSGRYHNALKILYKSMEEFDKLGDQDNKKITVLSNITYLYTELGMDSLALSTLNNIIELSGKTNNYYARAIARTQMVEIFESSGNYALAKAHNDSIIIDYEKNQYPADEVLTEANIWKGKDEYKRDSSGYSIQLIKNNLKSANLSGLNYLVVTAASYLADIYFERNQTDSSLYYCRMALDTAINYEFKDQLLHLHLLNARIERRYGRTQNAMDAYESFASSSKEYLDTITDQKLKDIAYFYELKQQEDEKRLLQQENDLNEVLLKIERTKNRQSRIIIFLSVVFIVFLLIVLIIIRKELKFRKKTNIRLNEENLFKNKLFSIVSHDLRSPIAQTEHAIFLLESPEIPADKKKRVLNEIEEKTTKTLNLIDNLLSWTKGQIQNESTQREEFNLYELLNDIIDHELISRRLDAIHLVNNFAKDRMIKTDKSVVHMVIRNLLSNALKFTPDGGKITLDFRENESEYLFSVKDTGDGIKHENKGKILGSDSIVSFKGMHGEKGKGIGLSLCKYFVEREGGRIWFDSEQGKGTCFYFSLPKGG